MNSYELSRAYFDWAFENPEKIKPMHTAIYFFAIEHCNRLGWKSKFGLPTSMAMEAIGVKSYKAYKECLDLLVKEGFITMVQKSTNQHSSNIVALNLKTKANTKALTKALSKHSTKQSQSSVESEVESNSSINKPNNHEPNNQERENQKPPAQTLNLEIEDNRDLPEATGRSLNKPKDRAELWDLVRDKAQGIGFTEAMVKAYSKQIEECYRDEVDGVWRRSSDGTTALNNWRKQIRTQWLTDAKILEFKNKYIKLHPQEMVASLPKSRTT
jgi:hypothetical protein